MLTNTVKFSPQTFSAVNLALPGFSITLLQKFKMQFTFFSAKHTLFGLQNFLQLSYFCIFLIYGMFSQLGLQNLRSNFLAPLMLPKNHNSRLGLEATGFVIASGARRFLFSETSGLRGVFLFAKCAAAVPAIPNFTTILLLSWYGTANAKTESSPVSGLYRKGYAFKNLISLGFKRFTQARSMVQQARCRTPYPASAPRGHYLADYKLVCGLLFGSARVCGNNSVGLHSLINGAGHNPRTGIFCTPFFLTSTYAMLRTRYATDNGRGSHVIRDSGFFFNLGDSTLASFFLAYYSSFFYGLLSSTTSSAAAVKVPELRTTALTSRFLGNSRNLRNQPASRRQRTNATPHTVFGADLQNTTEASMFISDSDNSAGDSLRNQQLKNGGVTCNDVNSELLSRGNFRRKSLPSLREDASFSGRTRNFGFFTGLPSGDSFDAPVFQMKPGYLGLWRHYRRLFAKYSPLRYFRQRR